MKAAKKTPNLIQSDPRALALRYLCRLDRDQSYALNMLHADRIDSSLKERDAALYMQLIKGTLQWRGKIDAALETFLEKGLSSLPAKVQNILRLGAYQIMFLDRIPKEVAVNESVNLTRKQKERNLAGLVNALLRNLVRELPRLMPALSNANSAEEIAISGSHPPWLVERWISQFGAEETRALCEANNRPWPVQLRANTLRIQPQELIEKLQSEGLTAKAARFSPECLTVETLPENRKLHELASYQSGLFQIQDESSALVSHIVDPQPGETVIDLCSAPGGKTTHLAALMKNTGRIVALDSSRRRLELVTQACRRLGISIVECAVSDGRTFRPQYTADRVLVDAPCSGLGVLGRKSDARWNKTPGMLKELAVLQLELLTNAARLVRKGGVLIYSTCSIDPEENEQVIESFLARDESFRPAPLPAIFTQLGLAGTQACYRSWPQRHLIGGAFGAALTRVL